MRKPEPEDRLRLRPREAEPVILDIPNDTLAALKKIAAKRDMSYQALLKFYIGQGLRQDIAQGFGEQVLDTAAHVLARHFQSAEEVASILREIRQEAIS
jgi:hypothetical protein